MLSVERRCKSIDPLRNGYMRSEAGIVLYVQKSSNSKRVYATLVNSRTNADGSRVRGTTSPSGQMRNKLTEAGINPIDVVYVEAHGTGNLVEWNTIADLFCEDRTTPLLIGFIRSDEGHSGPASSLYGIAEVLLAMETGGMPANLHYRNPNLEIPASVDVRLKIVDGVTSWEEGFVGVNFFVNTDVILRSPAKSTPLPVMDTKLPKVVVVSKRIPETESRDSFSGQVKENEKEDEFVALSEDLHNMNRPGHVYRGFQNLEGENIRNIGEYVHEKRPIWYVFSGMGSQWPGMGRELLAIDSFAQSLRHCANVLKPEGVDLMDLIENGTAETFDNVLNAFVAIAAIQVALVDVLTSVGIQPDGMVGHSIGELGCAYADGTLTPDQTVLAAYWQGKSILESKLPVGAMAAVGLSWTAAKSRCPDGILPSCHNSADSVTISGPVEAVTDFVSRLRKEDIFAKTVNSSGCAFHSEYISPAGAKMFARLERIIPTPKQRSSRWISSSVPEEAWRTSVAQFGSAGYHVNNLLSPVLFEEALAHVPENAIVIEIAPHGLLQAILNRSLTSANSIVSLQKRNHSNNLAFLLTNLNELYLATSEPKLAKLYGNQLSKNLEANVLKEGQWGSYRHLKLDQPQNDTRLIQVEHAYIDTLVKGDLSSLRWIQGPLSYHEPNEYLEDQFCCVYYAPLNFRDIMLATGKLTEASFPDDLPHQDSVLGLEFAGRNSRGRRVMGMVNGRGLVTTVFADPDFTWEVPVEWSLKEAATIPVAYATGYYALMVRGQIRKGDRVFIHAGTSDVGLASIAIALYADCEVFTMVESEEKRDFLGKAFSELISRNIGNSRDTSVEQFLHSATNGRGIDVVLNSLADQKLQAGIRCLAEHGRFLEVGKYDSSHSTKSGTAFFSEESSFHGIVLESLFGTDSFEKREVIRLMTQGILDGVVKPLPFTVFPEQQIERGFQSMVANEHIGKVIIEIRDEETENGAKSVAAVPRTYMNPYKSYVIVEGLGGFGLELADWMITRGARHVVLSSRSGIRTGYQGLYIRKWSKAGINIVVSTTDAATISGAENLIEETRKLAPVGGIFNLAAVLRDAPIKKLSENDFKTVALPKIDVTKCLDSASRKLCPALDHFVVFSSVSSGRGNAGQANYVLANSAMERIVEERRASGLPGLAIQWGDIGDVGPISEREGENDAEVRGTLPQTISSCLSTLDVFLRQQHPVLASMVLAEKARTVESADQDGLLEEIGTLLEIKDTKAVNFDKTLADFGMDSLLGMEIRGILHTRFDLALTLREISRLTFRKLVESSRRSNIKCSQAIKPGGLNRCN